MRQSVAGDRLSRSSTSALERMRGGGSGGFGDDNGSERAECGGGGSGDLPVGAGFPNGPAA